MIKRPKIAIVGAGGNVGASVAQWAAQKELGELVLIDIKMGPAEGRALDLTQCGPWEGFNNTSFKASDTPEAMADALWKQLNDSAHRIMLTERFTQMHHALLRDTAQQSANAVLNLIDRTRS